MDFDLEQRSDAVSLFDAPGLETGEHDAWSFDDADDIDDDDETPLLESRQSMLEDEDEDEPLIAERAFSEGHPWEQVGATTRFPYCAICHLEITFRNGRELRGTGWMTGPNTVVTAGHNIVHRDTGSLAFSMRVIPGRNRSRAPFGSTSMVKGYAVKKWERDRLPEHDFGVVHIDGSKLSTIPRYFEYGVMPIKKLRKRPKLTSVGFPEGRYHEYGSMWQDYGKPTGANKYFVKYRLDTEPGQSGAPVIYQYVKDPSKFKVMGVHVYSSAHSNLAVRLSQSYVNYINLRNKDR